MSNHESTFTFTANPTPEAWAVITLHAHPERMDSDLPDGARLLDVREKDGERWRIYQNVRPVVGWCEGGGQLAPVVADDAFGISIANVRYHDPDSIDLPTASVLRGPGQDRSIDLDASRGSWLLLEAMQRYELLREATGKARR